MTRTDHSAAAVDRALHRIVSEVLSGLKHGYFEYSLTCEVIGQGRRRLVLHAGKGYQFVLSQADCEPTNDAETIDSCDGSENDA